MTRPAHPDSNHRLWLAYAGLCLLSWMLYAMAGAELQRGLWQVWEAIYQATLSLSPPMLLGTLVWPWVQGLDRLGERGGSATQLLLHGLGALIFAAAWQLLEFTLAWILFGAMHAQATFQQTVLWRGIWGVFVYTALASGFTAVLNARRARRSALAAAQAESALARAELAAISGKLNPHFLFNTLNSLIALTRKDAKAAESALLRFSGMLRYVLDTKRGADTRVSLAEEVEFVRDYLALETLRLGERLTVRWEVEPETLQDEIPPLSLQPLVENCIQHGVAPRAQGGSVRIAARRDVLNDGLALTVQDDGPGCDLASLATPTGPDQRRGIGLAALQRRFALDYEGRARLKIHTAPGAGFRVDLWIPQT